MPNDAGIERNVKTGSRGSVIIALIIGAVVIFGSRLDLKQIWQEIKQSGALSPQMQESGFSRDIHWAKNHSVPRVSKQKESLDLNRTNAPHLSAKLPLLMVAVQNNNLHLIKRLIENGVNPKIQDIDGNEALAYVTNETTPETIAFLLEQGLDINHRNKFQNTPLMFAIRYNNVDNVRFMVEHGADVMATTRSGRTMVSMARGEEVRAYLRALEQSVPAPLTRVWWRQAKLEDVDKAFAQYPQIFQNRKIMALAAANTQDLRVIAFLMQKGFDLNVSDETGITPIFAAASSNGNPNILRFLVEQGADVNRQDEVYGTTPLMAAAY
ncbi:MAG: ankyrin repeat domain-containing protein, partial [Pseudomonadota bacterium]|nr:ankyrin repeat domain-containing protein [Pseudomonadota bacterium]